VNQAHVAQYPKMFETDGCSRRRILNDIANRAFLECKITHISRRRGSPMALKDIQCRCGAGHETTIHSYMGICQADSCQTRHKHRIRRPLMRHRLSVILELSATPCGCERDYSKINRLASGMKTAKPESVTPGSCGLSAAIIACVSIDLLPGIRRERDYGRVRVFALRTGDRGKLGDA